MNTITSGLVDVLRAFINSLRHHEMGLISHYHAVEDEDDGSVNSEEENGFDLSVRSCKRV